MEFISEGIFGKYLVLPSLRALLWYPVQKKIFSLIKKIFLQTLVELMFRYHKIFCFGTTLYKMNKNKNITYGVLGIK